MTNEQLMFYLKKNSACREAREWVGERDAETAWAECPRADWMLWIASKSADRKRLVWVACQCARLALRHVPEGEKRPLAAIEAAEAWTRGESAIAQVRSAANAAADANAAYAAYAAADANAAYAAYAAAADAAYAAYAYAYATYVYADAASAAQSKMCAIVRAEWPTAAALAAQ